jgi:hypothetical protein
VPSKHRYFYQAFDIKENDGMFIAPENVLESGNTVFINAKPIR